MTTIQNFDFNSIPNFDDHIKKSIPNYDFLSNQIKEYVECFASENTSVIDLGCSTGRMLKSISKRKSVEYIGVDSASELLIGNKNIDTKLIDCDVLDFDKVYSKPPSVISCVFLMQFLNNSSRKKLLDKIKNSLIDGGCFICCEKTHFDNPVLENITQTMHLTSKLGNFKVGDVLLKQRELSRSMWLKTNSELIDELSTIGEPHIFWKSFGFTGVIIFKR